jgi:glycosidase
MVAFFGEDDGDELTMQFDFVANQALYLALARQDAAPLATALAARPALARGNQWGNFVRNHDELTLDQLSESERDEVFEAFAPLESQRIHGRGIVRRLPPMLDGDPRRIRMVYSLMFSTPGAPVLFYGEEIGMGENPAVSGRGAVRTPMQWSDEPGGGFSGADADELVTPVATEGWAPEHVNVSRQRHEPDSMLRFVQGLIRQYRASPEIGWGDLTLLESGHGCVLAHAVDGSTGTLVAVHNFAPDGRSVDLDLSTLDLDDSARVVDLFAELATPEALGEAGHLRIELEGYGFRWLRVLRAGEKRLV